MGTSKIHHEPIGNNRFRRHFRYLGKQSNNRLIYMKRPPNGLRLNQAQTSFQLIKIGLMMHLSEIEIAFRWKKPAIRSSHRVNYIGWLNEKNRTKGLRELDKLLFQIIKYWPNVEFMTSSELGNLINETGS